MVGSIRTELLEHNYLNPKLVLHIGSGLLFLYTLHWLATSAYAWLFEVTPSLNVLFIKYIGTSAFLALVAINLFYGPIYYFNIPFFMQYKVNTVPWPWEQDPESWPRLLKKAIRSYIFNQMVLGILFIYLILPFLATDFSLNLPSFSTFLRHIFISVCLEDFFFYFSHRLLHLPFFYKRIHKIHHEFNNPINIFNVHTHWVEFIIGNMIPLFGSAMALGRHMHISTLIGFICFRLGESNEVHSGFEFPWSPYKILPISNDSAFHNYHHIKNIGNYGTFFTFWDWYFGTSNRYNKDVNSGMSK